MRQVIDLSSSIQVTTLILAAMLLPRSLFGAAAPVDLRWLDGTPPAVPTGVSWGVSWPQGQVPKGQAFTLTGPDGKAYPLQSWITGYWPDGSIKWTGFSTVAGPEAAALRVAPAATAAQPATAVKVTQAAGTIQIDTGKIIAIIPTQGENLISSIKAGDNEVARRAQLQLIGVLA